MAGRKIGFLHISKTGGTAAKAALRRHVASDPEDELVLFTHSMTLEKAFTEEGCDQVIFYIREPVSRFVSGFNSRLRAGYPRHARAWTPRETRAFARFKTPNELAEALGSFNPLSRFFAWRAVRAIRHTRQTYAHFLGSVDVLERYRDRILFIGSQEHFEADFDIIKTLIGADPGLELPTDDVGAHRNPVELSKFMSERARRNVRSYYRKDYPVYEWCAKRRAELVEKYGRQSAG
jgi:hypothetical protein